MKAASLFPMFFRFRGLAAPVNALIAAIAWLTLANAAAQLVPPDADDGKTQIEYPDEPFKNFSANENGVSFVKFSILLNDPNTVYFQDSEKYPFHYDFAINRLQPFLGLSRSQFDAVSLRILGQQAVLGAVLYAPFDGPREIGIQFVGSDAYPKEEIAQWFNVVRSAVLSPAGQTAPVAIYMPTFEQRAVAEAEREWFQSQGIVVGGPERWLTGDQAYSSGWALGRLVFIPAAEIEQAYADGRLHHDDILLTDGVPAELPFLAGIVSLAAATPNSHVAILAQNQGVPFAYVAAPAKQARLQTMIGREILLRVRDGGFGSEVLITAVDAALDPKLRVQILAYKKPQPARIAARGRLGRIGADVTNLTPRDVRFFGGKASNFGLLRRTIPDNSPPAMAFSFDLWEQFLGNVNPDSGMTLRDEISERLGGFTWPVVIAEVRPQLEDVRQLIRKKVKFTEAQKSAIISALLAAGFDPMREVRFRSSTNAEDTAVLTGAGLYESFNGCIADSTDGDQVGPSQCCPDELEEDTVLGAIDKVYASFYNENAWLERIRHGVPEKHSGMAVLAHHNFPDDDELANGVVTLTRKRRTSGGGGGVIGTSELAAREIIYEAKIVTQLGATSVTNPPGGAKAEVVSATEDGGEPYFFTEKYSSLVQLGGHPMEWEQDYRELFGLLKKVADAYATMFPAKREFTLDFEFKRVRIVPEQAKLIVKQVREVVPPKPQRSVPFLLNDPSQYVVFQGEFGDAFASHRLKCALDLQTRNLRLVPSQLAPGLHKESSIQFLEGATVRQLSGGPAAWPGWRYSSSAGAAIDRWFFGNGAARTEYKLRTALTVRADATEELVFTQRDFAHTLAAIYRSPRPFIDFEGIKQRQSDSVTLVPRESLPPQAEPVVRRISHPGGVNVETRFYWPKYEGFVIIKTFPLAAWVETRITGLTTDPMVLVSEFAQTYAPGHHNFTETFIFEPRIDPNVTASQRAELEARNIQLLHIHHDVALGFGDTWHVLGLDGQFRSDP